MTVRIDTLRSQLGATRTLLGDLEAEVDDLHSLAYERQRTQVTDKVSGGERDYALDTHGDPVARAAYRHLGEAVATACGDLALALDAAAKVLRAGGPTGRPGRRAVTAAEHAEALAAQARRAARGEGHVRNVNQPGRDAAIAALDARARAAEKRADKLQRKLDKAKPKPKGDGWRDRLRAV